MGTVHFLTQQIFIGYYYVQGTLVGTGKTDKNPCPSGSYMLERRGRQ